MHSGNLHHTLKNIGAVVTIAVAIRLIALM